MNEEYIKQENGPHMIQKWISVGDVIVLVSSLIALGVTYGNLSADVASLKEDVKTYTTRDITPGAAQAIAAIQQINQAQDRELSIIRGDSAEFRKEVRDSLKRIEDKLSDHDKYTKR